MTANVNLIAFEPKHTEEIRVRNPENSVFKKSELFGDWAKVYSEFGPAYTLIAEGDGIIGIGGIIQLSPGVGEGWVFISDLIKKYPKVTHKTVKRILEKLPETMNIHRVQTFVMEDFIEGQSWAKSLGFTAEGVLRQFGPNRENFIMYARLYDGIRGSNSADSKRRRFSRKPGC